MNDVESGVVLTNEAPRARALRTLRRWIEEGVMAAGETLPSEREISLRLGVGLATTQRALRVMEAEGLVIKHGGRTRTVGRSQRSHRGLLSDSVLMLGQSDEPMLHSQPLGWAGYVAMGALLGLREHSLHAMVLRPETLTEPEFGRMLQGEPLGVVVPELTMFGIDGSVWAGQAVEAGVPAVVYGDEPGCEVFDRVVPDHEAGAYELAKWLIARGRKDIRQYWTFSRAPRWAEARQRGYERAMREAGLAPLEAVVSVAANYPGIDPNQAFVARSQAVAGALLPFVHGQARTDAIMVVSDGEVGPVHAAMRMLGRTPSVEIEVVGYDNYWEQSSGRESEPAGPLATVDKNNVDTGRELVSLLLDRRNGNLPPEPQMRLVRPTLRVMEPAQGSGVA